MAKVVRRTKNRVEHKLQITYEAIDSIKQYPNNPNVGGQVDGIALSIVKNGFYNPLTVQKSTRYILTGNHSWKAGKQLDMSEIACVVVDVDDEGAKRIVIGDNELARQAEIDKLIVGEIMRTMESVQGTGYTDEQAQALMQAAEDAAANAVEAASEIADMAADAILDTEDPLGIGIASDDDEFDEDEVDDIGVLEDAPEELEGAFQLDANVLYLDKQATGYWQIPKLRLDQLMTANDLPKNLRAWAGSATKDWPDSDQWWLYNFGIDSTSGMRDVSKVIISFYTHDEYFEPWWHNSEKYVAKVIRSKIKYAIMPDFSQWTDEPRVLSLYNLYRNFWIARFMQDAGIKVVPSISWRYSEADYLRKYVIPLFPKNLPLLSTQVQTFDHSQTDEQLKSLKAFWIEAINALKPQHMLVYAGPSGIEFFKALGLGVPATFIENRMVALSEKAKQRERKVTI